MTETLGRMGRGMGLSNEILQRIKTLMKNNLRLDLANEMTHRLENTLECFQLPIGKVKLRGYLALDLIA